jgi:hypothetical protein
MKSFCCLEYAELWCARYATGCLVMWVRDGDGDKAMVWDGKVMATYTMSAYEAAQLGLRFRGQQE